MPIISVSILEIQTRTESICGHAVQIHFCKSVACSLSDLPDDDCVDGGVVTVGESTVSTYPCGSQVIERFIPTTCECKPSSGESLDVRVLAGNTGIALPAKTVEIRGATSADTDMNGQVNMTLPAGSSTVIVSVSDSSGQYLDTSRTVDTTVTNVVTLYMFEKARPVVIDPVAGATLSVSENVTNVESYVLLEIPPSSFYDGNGSLVDSKVSIFVNYIPPDLDIDSRAPGVFRAVDGSGLLTELQTGGVFTVTAEDESGNRLSSPGLLVTARHNFKLFVLTPDQTWKLVRASATRTRRQITTTYNFIGEVGIPLKGITWYNIDKFPENTKCWFKAEIYDISTGELMSNQDTVTRFTAITVARTNEPAIFPLRRYRQGTSDLCFEIRCDSDTTLDIPEGHIALEIKFLEDAPKRADPFDISQYDTDVRETLRNLNYVKNVSDPAKPSIRVDFIANTSGPFFLEKEQCDIATENVFKRCCSTAEFLRLRKCQMCC